MTATLELHSLEFGNVSATWTIDGRREEATTVAAGRLMSAYRFDLQLGSGETLGERPHVPPQILAAGGRDLANMFDPNNRLAGFWRNNSGRLAISTNEPRLLNLPWELIPVDQVDTPLGCHVDWSLLRMPVGPLPPADGRLPAGPLRVLFLAAAPKELLELDFEKEEDALLDATFDLAAQVVISEQGTLSALEGLLDRHRPHIVHLSGHGDVDVNGTGWFYFEDEGGHSHPVEATAIANSLKDLGVRLVFLNACQTARSAQAGLCQGLVLAGVPAAIGWNIAVEDGRATSFAEEFYRQVAKHNNVPSALALARQRLRREGLLPHVAPGGGDLQDPMFAQAQLYGTETVGPLWGQPMEAAEFVETTRTHFAPLEHDVAGLADGFIGRRREQQELLPALRSGQLTVVVLHGPGGQGKSTLATRLVNRLQPDGYSLLVIKPVRNRTCGESPAACATRAASELVTKLASLGDSRIDFSISDPARRDNRVARFQRLADLLNDARVLLLLDNWEDVLDEDTREIADEALAAFYTRLGTHLTHGSRVIVTSRYVPEGVSTQGRARVFEALTEFRESEFLKFLSRSTTLRERIELGMVRRDVLRGLYRKSGGLPRFVNRIRTLLEWIPIDEVANIPAEGGRLTDERGRYVDEHFGRRLLELIGEVGRDVVRRVAVSNLPLPLEAVQQLTNLDIQSVIAAVTAGFNYGLLLDAQSATGTRLFHAPGTWRPWLVEQLTPDERRAAHRTLAKFWKEVREADREADVGVTRLESLDAVRSHAQVAGEGKLHCWATVRRVTLLRDVSEFRQSRVLLDEVDQADRDADWLQASGDIEESLSNWPEARRLYTEARRLYTETLARGGLSIQAEGQLLHQIAMIDVHEGHYPEAREMFYKSLEIMRQFGDRASEAAVWHNLASIEVNEGHYPKAREMFLTALEMRQHIGDCAGEAATWHGLATLDVNEARYLEARQKFHNALKTRQRIGDRAGEAVTWHNLASIDRNEGDYPEARKKLLKSLQMRQQIGDRVGEAYTWHSIASVDLSEGNYAEAREKFLKTLQMRQQIGDRTGEAATWHQLASIDVQEGHYPAGREKLLKSLEINQSIGNRVGEAATWHQLASIDVNEGRYAAARETLLKTLQMRQEIGDRNGEADTWHQLASIDVEEHLYAEAREKFLKSLEIKQQIGDRSGEAATWHQLASIDLHAGRYPEARKTFSMVLSIYQQIGDRAGEAVALHQLATVDLNEGRYPQAREMIVKSLEIEQQIGDRAGEAATWHQLATIDVQEGRYPAARKSFLKALELRQQIGDRAGEAATWHGLATIELYGGQYLEARETFLKSLQMRHQVGDRAGVAATLHQLATIDFYEGHYQAARVKFLESLDVKQQIGDRAGEAATWHNLASIDLEEGRYPVARESFLKALELRQQIGDRAGEATTWHQLATIDLEQGSYPEARRTFHKALQMRQLVGDPAGEAATWFQLGMLVWKSTNDHTRRLAGLQLLAFGSGINRQIGHPDADRIDHQYLAGCQQMGLPEQDVEAHFEAALASYATDRGAALLATAFPPEPVESA